MVNLSEHLCPLHLDCFDFFIELALLGPLVGDLVTLCNSLFTETASLEVFLVQKALCSRRLIVQIEVKLGPK